MNFKLKYAVALFCIGSLASCVSKKEYLSLQSEFEIMNKQLGTCNDKLSRDAIKLENCERELENFKKTNKSTSKLKDEQINSLREQVSDLKKQRDKQFETVEGLTVLSKSANDNIKETLAQMEKRDKYINALKAAKSKTDSINLALSYNLKSELRDGIADNDIDVKVDKSVVFINLSDKMLFTSGSSTLTSKANGVLSKIAKIIENKPNLEVMVEGYTDNKPIKKSGIKDNWDLSVKRATSVVRVLQMKYGVNPSRLIAAGRGEYLPIADNNTSEGRSLNRRTRIVILPKLDQFYDLLKPNEE